MTWTVDNVHGRPLAFIGLHPHAAVKGAWLTRRAAEFRKSMRALEEKVTELLEEYGEDLDVVVVGDLNYPDRKDTRYWTPRRVFGRLGLQYVAVGIDWMAWSKGLRLVDQTVINAADNGQDHPWIEGEFERV
jgi:hypothetical protein